MTNPPDTSIGSFHDCLQPGEHPKIPKLKPSDVNIYLASSWKNPHQPKDLAVLLDAGFSVYDFRNPCDGDNGFSWREVEPEWRTKWPKDPRAFAKGLSHPIAENGFALDMQAIDSASVCVLCLPAGNSAHLEAGFMVARGAPLIVIAHEGYEPELMYLMGSPHHTYGLAIVESAEEACQVLRTLIMSYEWRKHLTDPDWKAWWHQTPIAPVFRTKQAVSP